MKIFTIPKDITKGTDLVVLTRKEYEALLHTNAGAEFHATQAQRKNLHQARKNRARGKVLSLDDLKKGMGLAN